MSKFVNSIKLFYLRILKYKFKIFVNNLITKIQFEKSSKYDRILSDLKKDGYSKIENFVSLEKCKEIVDIVDIYLKENSQKIWRENDNDCDLRLFGAEKIDKLIDEYFRNEEILKIGNLHIKSPLKNIFTLAGKTSLTKKNNFGSGGGWHRDSINPSFKAMLYLTDVNIGDGNLQIIHESNKFNNIVKINTEINKDLLNTRFKNEEIASLIETFDFQVIDVFGKAGTLVLFDGSYVHRGSPIINNTRYALTNYFYLNIDINKIKYPSPMI